MKRVLVCGGRYYANRMRVMDVLDRIMNEHEDTIIVIQGGATGADALAANWAEMRGMPCAEVKPNWRHYGKAAGTRRNGWMLMLQPDLVVAFPGGNGTRNMIYQADMAGIEVMRIDE